MDYNFSIESTVDGIAEQQDILKIIEIGQQIDHELDIKVYTTVNPLNPSLQDSNLGCSDAAVLRTAANVDSPHRLCKPHVFSSPCRFLSSKDDIANRNSGQWPVTCDQTPIAGYQSPDSLLDSLPFKAMFFTTPMFNNALDSIQSEEENPTVPYPDLLQVIEDCESEVLDGHLKAEPDANNALVAQETERNISPVHKIPPLLPGQYHCNKRRTKPMTEAERERKERQKKRKCRVKNVSPAALRRSGRARRSVQRF